MNDIKIYEAEKPFWFPAELKIVQEKHGDEEPVRCEEQVILSGKDTEGSNSVISPDMLGISRRSPSDETETQDKGSHSSLAGKSLIGLTMGLVLLGAAGHATAYAQANEAPPQGNHVEQVLAQPESPKTEPVLYTVEENDNLSGIAEKYDVTLQDLIKANPQIKNPRIIHPGDTIRIPGGGNTANAPAAPVAPAAPSVRETAPVEEKKADITQYKFPVAGYSKETEIQTHWGVGERGGTDLFGRRGATIYSVSSGVVQSAGHNEAGGNSVRIKGDDGRVYYYAHLDKLPVVRAGQKVKAGQKIGVMGDSGNAKGTGVHLHIGIGEDIQLGSGASGGCGTNFDAVTFLQQLLDAS